MPAGFRLLIAAQFASALADNALLIVTIALLQVQGLPGWWAPMLKFGFTISYVLLAPFVGPLADAFPKARLMAWMNGVKVVDVMALLLGAHPVLAFAIVGFGAAAYAPAKYGLITELVAAEPLVAANGWLEVSVVCTALIGTVFGGLLVSPWVLESALTLWLRQAIEATAMIDAIVLRVSLLALLSVYALAGVLNVGVPDSGARYPASRIHPIALTDEFWRAHRTLWRDRDGGLSLAVTTIFWASAPRCSLPYCAGPPTCCISRSIVRPTCRPPSRWASSPAQPPPDAGCRWPARKACWCSAWRWGC